MKRRTSANIDKVEARKWDRLLRNQGLSMHRGEKVGRHKITYLPDTDYLYSEQWELICEVCGKDILTSPCHGLEKVIRVVKV